MENENKKIAKITVERDSCISAASCVIAADSVFELDGENKAVMKLKNGENNSGPVERDSLEAKDIDDKTLLDAAKSCPTKAILLFGEDGTQVYP